MEMETKIGFSGNGAMEKPMGLKCSICETEILLDQARECQFCHGLFCANHIMPCEACGIELCVDCMEYPEDEPICPECARMITAT
jgi:hypothetical protein